MSDKLQLHREHVTNGIVLVSEQDEEAFVDSQLVYLREDVDKRISDLEGERDEAQAKFGLLRAVLIDVNRDRDFVVRCNDWIQGRVYDALKCPCCELPFGRGEDQCHDESCRDATNPNNID